MMAKERKRLGSTMSGEQLAAAVREYAQQIWLAGLGAFSTAREESNKVFEALVREGETIQSVTQKAVGARLKEAAAKAAGTRDMLEHLLEDSVARSLKRFGVPTRKDIDTLSKHLAALSALVDKLTAEAARKRVAAKRASGGR